LLATAQVTIKGSIWSNGYESACNWYFQDNKACMEIFIAQDPNNLGVQSIKMIMDAQTGKLTIVSRKNSEVLVYEVSADSIQAANYSLPLFLKTAERTAEQLEKYQAVTHQNEWMFLLQADVNVNLSLFKAFLKDDAAFAWIAQQGIKGFPERSIMVDSRGNLIRSWRTLSIENKVDDAVFLAQ
jgi:hypothetical protein